LHTQVQDLQGFLTDEDVGENWLENDMPSTSRPNKKRRLAAPIEKCRCVYTKTGMALYTKIKKQLVFSCYCDFNRKIKHLNIINSTVAYVL
jgi:hypothetical protein